MHGKPIYEVNGEKLRMVDLARRANLDVSTVYFRLRRGWSPARILATPVIPPSRRSECRTIKARSGHYGWLPAEYEVSRIERRVLLEKAKRHDPEALAELRGMHVLCWQRADVGAIL